MGRPISSAAVRLGRRGQKRRPNAPTQTDARPFFVRGRPIPGPFLSRICVGADTRRTRARLLLSPGPLVCGTLASPLTPPPANKQPSPRLLRHRRRRPFLPATLPAAAASTSAQQRRPCPQSPAAAVLPPGSKLVPAAASPTAQPPATKKTPRRPRHIRPARSSDAVTLVGRRQGS